MRRNAAAELKSVQKKLAQKIKEAEVIESFFVRLHRQPEVELEKAEIAVIRKFAQERFNALLDEISVLRSQERKLKQRLKPKSK